MESQTTGKEGAIRTENNVSDRSFWVSTQGSLFGNSFSLNPKSFSTLVKMLLPVENPVRGGYQSGLQSIPLVL